MSKYSKNASKIDDYVVLEIPKGMRIAETINAFLEDAFIHSKEDGFSDLIGKDLNHLPDEEFLQLYQEYLSSLTMKENE